MAKPFGIEERKQRIGELTPFIIALACSVGGGAFIYLIFGILYAFVNLWWPSEVAAICGYEFSESDYTRFIHMAIGIFSLGLSATGVWGIRDLILKRRLAKAGIAVFAMLAYSCGVAMMPTAEYAPLVILGLILLGMNFLSGFFMAYLVSELAATD